MQDEKCLSEIIYENLNIDFETFVNGINDEEKFQDFKKRMSIIEKKKKLAAENEMKPDFFVQNSNINSNIVSIPDNSTKITISLANIPQIIENDNSAINEHKSKIQETEFHKKLMNLEKELKQQIQRVENLNENSKIFNNLIANNQLKMSHSYNEKLKTPETEKDKKINTLLNEYKSKTQEHETNKKSLKKEKKIEIDEKRKISQNLNEISIDSQEIEKKKIEKTLEVPPKVPPIVKENSNQAPSQTQEIFLALHPKNEDD